MDGNSNVQTIENFFDMAFLIKDKKVKVQVDTEGDAGTQSKPNLPVAVPIYNDEIDEMDTTNSVTKKQQVMSLNIRDVAVLSKLLALVDSHPGSGSSTSSSSTSSSSSNTNASNAPNALHREDELYRKKSAHDQADLLESRKENKKKKRRTQ